MADFSDRRQLTVTLVLVNLAARGWLAAGLGAIVGFVLADLGALGGPEDFQLYSIGLMASVGLYMVAPGVVLSGTIAAVRRWFFERVVWGNAHWIFPLMVAVVAIGVGWVVA